MSSQVSIRFDPSALLTIKKEIDDSVRRVEIAIQTLHDEQQIPFELEETLEHFDQCAQVLQLIDMGHLSQMIGYISLLVRKIMQAPALTDATTMAALSEGTTMLKRYIEFTALHEVKAPQFLLDTLNRLELALGKPLTQEGQRLITRLNAFKSDLSLPLPPKLEQSEYVHQLYKHALHKLIQHSETTLDLQAIKLIGAYLANAAKKHHTKQYWQLVYVALDHIDQLILSDARLRILIQIESNIGKFFEQPDEFRASITDLANIISLCVSQDDAISELLRRQLRIGDDQLTDTQLQVLSSHLYGPDYDTIHAVCQLINESMTQIRNEIEYNYLSMTPEKIQELQAQLSHLANVFKVLNLHEANRALAQQAEHLNQPDILTHDGYAQQLMRSILSAMNSIGILERNYTSNRLQLRAHNMNISLDRLDDAHAALLHETKLVVNAAAHALEATQATEATALDLGTMQQQLNELAGAALFLGAKELHKALHDSAQFMGALQSNHSDLKHDDMSRLLNILACLDLFIDNLKTKQPVLRATFEVALRHSSHFQSAVA